MDAKREFWLDAAGRKRRITPLQQKILYWRLDHPDARLSECARALKCSYTAVFKTERNPLCIAEAAAIKGMVDKAKVMQIQERQERLTEIARASITDFVAPDGQITITADNPHHRAVAEFGVTEGKFGEQRRIKLHSPLEAIKILDQEDGLYRDSPPVNQDNRVTNFVFILPDGTQVSPAALSEVKKIASGNSNP